MPKSVGMEAHRLCPIFKRPLGLRNVLFPGRRGAVGRDAHAVLVDGETARAQSLARGICLGAEVAGGEGCCI